MAAGAGAYRTMAESAQRWGMSEHLRYAGRPHGELVAVIERFVHEEPVLMAVLEGLVADGLPDQMLVAGAIYNLCWNRLTGRAPLNGINDLDVCYFDPDTSWEAEDVVIRRLAARFAGLPLPVQVRNQARVHLWFPQKYGATDFAPLTSSEEMLSRYASTTHAVAARLDADERMTVMAPFGLDDIFAFRMVPNPVLPNRVSHEAKGARAKGIWPEVTVVPWPG
ncbi:MAG: nucleotidyltransferase family protein [Devosia sp.]